MPPYNKFRSSKSLVNSKYISDNGLSLPSSVNLQKNDIAYIVRCLKKFYQHIRYDFLFFDKEIKFKIIITK